MGCAFWHQHRSDSAKSKPLHRSRGISPSGLLHAPWFPFCMVTKDLGSSPTETLFLHWPHLLLRRLRSFSLNSLMCLSLHLHVCLFSVHPFHCFVLGSMPVSAAFTPYSGITVPSPAASRAPGLEFSFLSPASSTRQPSSSRSPSPCCLLLCVLMLVVFLVQNVCGLGPGVRLGPGSCLCPLPIWWAVDKPPFLPASVSSFIN